MVAVIWAKLRLLVNWWRTQALAASATVLPQMLASINCTAKSGCHWSRQTSRKVPLPPLLSILPQPSPSNNSRCNNLERAKALGLRKSSSTVSSSALGFRRSVRCWLARSLCSGVIGVVGGTAPSRSLITSCRSISRSKVSSPKQRVASAASFNSSRVGNGLSRNAVNVSANRTASITLAVATSCPSLRSSRAMRASQPAPIAEDCSPA